MTGRFVGVALALAAVLYGLMRFLPGFLLSGLSVTTPLLYSIGVWLPIGTVLVASAAVVAHWAGARGWRLLVAAVIAAVIPAVVLVLLLYAAMLLVDARPATPETALLSESFMVLIVLAWSASTVLIGWRAGRASALRAHTEQAHQADAHEVEST